MFRWFLLLIAYLPFQIALNPGVVLDYFGWDNLFLKSIDIASLRVFIIFLFLFFLASSFYNKKTNFKIQFQKIIRDWRLWSFFCFFLLALFSLITANNAWWGFRKILYFLSLLPLYLIVTELFFVLNLSKIKKILVVLSFGAGVVAICGLFQFMAPFIFGLGKVQNFWALNIIPLFSGFNLGGMILSRPSWFVNVWGEDIMRSFSFFSDPHMLSFYGGLVLPLILSVWYLVKNKTTKSFLLLSVISVYGACLLSFSRGSYLALIFSLGIFFCLACSYWCLSWRSKIISFFVLMIVFSLFVLPITPIAGRFYSSFDLEEGSNQGRLEMWQESANQGLSHGFSGVGLGNYSLAVNTKVDYRNPITAHNLYLDFFSEMGFLGLAFWVILILGSLFQLWQKLKVTKNINNKIIISGLMTSLVYFAIHSFFETAVYNPVVFAVFLIVLGLSAVVTSSL